MRRPPCRIDRHGPRRVLRAGALVLASLGIAAAAPPAGQPVFIHVQGLAPTSVGLNGFIVGGDFTEGGAFQWMPTSGVTLVGGGLGTGYISRDGQAMAGTVIDLNRLSKRPGGGWKAVAHARLARPERCPASAVFDVPWTSGDGRVCGLRFYGTDLAAPCDLSTASDRRSPPVPLRRPDWRLTRPACRWTPRRCRLRHRPDAACWRALSGWTESTSSSGTRCRGGLRLGGQSDGTVIGFGLHR